MALTPDFFLAQAFLIAVSITLGFFIGMAYILRKCKCHNLDELYKKTGLK